MKSCLVTGTTTSTADWDTTPEQPGGTNVYPHIRNASAV